MGRWHDTFDWAKAIELNRDGLLRVLALLLASAGLKAGDVVATLPRYMHSSFLRVLRPAESAVRRLIIVAARGLSLPAYVERDDVTSRFDFSKLKQGTSKRVPSFQLIDPRKRFDLYPRRKWTHPSRVPRIISFDEPLPASYQEPPKPSLDDEVDATRIMRRLQALQNALDDLPKQVKRLLRTQMRRAKRPPGPGCVGPMRPGLPPGYKRKPRTQVDEILTECHTLALYSLEPPT